MQLKYEVSQFITVYHSITVSMEADCMCETVINLTLAEIIYSSHDSIQKFIVGKSF